jgi:multiple sugar transport system substrate-binding protein
MYKPVYRFISIALICFTFTSCYKPKQVNKVSMPADSNSVTHPTLDKNDSFELTIWNSNYDMKYVESQLKTSYPNATCKIVKLDGDAVSLIYSALYSGIAPDLIFYDISQVNQLNSIDGFEDLSSEPYNAAQLKHLYTESEWRKGLSFHGSRKIAIPLTPSVAATFYRADILEQCGITTDPEQLARLMSTSAGWLSVADKLKMRNKYMIDWKNQLIELYNTNIRLFDENMNFSVDKLLAADIINTSNRAAKMGFESTLSVWTPKGQEAIRKGDLPILYLGDWGMYQIAHWAPETSGKWRVTSLPFGIKREWGQSFVSIPSKAKYKEEAWGLLKKFAVDDKTGIYNIRDTAYEFLGNQKANIIFDEIRKELPSPSFTPMDIEAASLWKSGLYSAFDKDDALSIINNTEKNINEKLGKQMNFLSDYLKNSK